MQAEQMLTIRNRNNEQEPFSEDKLRSYIRRYTSEDVNIDKIVSDVEEYVKLKEDVTTVDLQNEVLSIVEGLISVQESHWQQTAGSIKMDAKREEVFRNRKFDHGLERMLTLAHENNQYTDFFQKYTSEELQQAEDMIDYNRDYLLHHVGAQIAYNRYVTSITTKKEADGVMVNDEVETIETLQERYMVISLFLLQDETKNRMQLVEEAYNAMSNQFFTVATPTFMSSGRPSGNLSSCFIGTVDDSIQGIYQEAEQFAKISKNAGGYGLYFGFVRSSGSTIKGKPNMSSGSIPFMKLFDVTASSVDQMGSRRGAVTIYLDVFHPDLGDFLKSPLPNTSHERQMHNIFLGVTIPDEFFRALQRKEMFYQFDPKETKDVMGYHLADYYDETTTGGSFTDKYKECVQAYKNGKLQLVKEVDPKTVLAEINRTRQEKGHPFLFFRDTVNRDNPNQGMIYSSNLCMEIAIPQSPSYADQVVQYDENGDAVIVETYKPGDIPTCNLSSLNLSKVAHAQNNGDDWRELIKSTVDIQYRLLANVIHLNEHTEMPQTKVSSLRKREVGLGTMGLAHALALVNKPLDSDTANDWQHEVYDEIAYHTVRASMELSKETQDPAPAFTTSKWADGSYIENKYKKHSEHKDRWEQLNQEVQTHGLYSTVLNAIAPTETISYISGTSAGNDPIFGKEYTLEKAGVSMNMVAPDINMRNFFTYKDGFILDKKKFFEGVGTRQKFIDQAISTNLYYVQDSVKGVQMIQDYINAWKNGVKTIYYHRSESQKAYDTMCQSCAG